jgi:hypothetical protein
MQDDLIFIPERYRIQFTFIFRFYCWTGARLSAFFTDGLRYRDVDIGLQRAPGGGWRLIYNIKQRWAKNNRDPENIVFGSAGKEDKKLVYNDAAFSQPWPSPMVLFSGSNRSTTSRDRRFLPARTKSY